MHHLGFSSKFNPRVRLNPIWGLKGEDLPDSTCMHCNPCYSVASTDPAPCTAPSQIKLKATASSPYFSINQRIHKIKFLRFLRRHRISRVEMYPLSAPKDIVATEVPIKRVSRRNTDTAQEKHAKQASSTTRSKWYEPGIDIWYVL